MTRTWKEIYNKIEEDHKNLSSFIKAPPSKFQFHDQNVYALMTCSVIQKRSICLLSKTNNYQPVSILDLSFFESSIIFLTEAQKLLMERSRNSNNGILDFKIVGHFCMFTYGSDPYFFDFRNLDENSKAQVKLVATSTLDSKLSVIQGQPLVTYINSASELAVSYLDHGNFTEIQLTNLYR